MSKNDGYFDQGPTMSASSDTATANELLLRLENFEARRLNTSPKRVRSTMASRLRAMPGTLENIRRLRLKTIPSWLMSRMRGELVSAMQHEIARLEHELAIHRQIGTDPGSNDFAKAEAALGAARQIMRGDG